MSMIKNFTYPNDKLWTIYTKSNCDYCTKVKKLLKLNDISCVVVDSDEYIQDTKSKELFLSQMEYIIGKKYRTFPMVFNGTNFIGGFTDTENYIDSINKLKSNNNLIFEEDF
jgi:glutaredoxin